MRSVLAVAVVVSASPCQSDESSELELVLAAEEQVLGDTELSEAFDEDPTLKEHFDATVRDVFARPERYRWVWTTPRDDNPVVGLFESLERAWVPTPIAKVMAYAAAQPDLLPAQWAPAGPVDADGPVEAMLELPIPVDGTRRAGVTMGRAVAIPCIAALQQPPVTRYPLGELPPVPACRVIERYALR